MHRNIYDELIHWKNQSDRMPLLLRGARQVGKTYVVEHIGQQYFDFLHTINFELEPEYTQCFESLNPKAILDAITGLSGQAIVPGKSLLFLDEIQSCPQAIMALRYFKEKMPELHVIAAGSLLEFALKDQSLSMPVGRVEYIYLKPLSFNEFLQATGHMALLKQIQTATIEQPLPQVLHHKLLKLLKIYMLVGGMPAAIESYLTAEQFQAAQRQQTIILATYRDDFAKYAKKTAHKYLQKIFIKAPALIGQQIKYAKIDTDFRARDLKQAIENLNYTGVISSVYATTAAGLPLDALLNEKKFKLLFLDIGLVNRLLRTTPQDLLCQDIMLNNKGALAEQLVGQELQAYMDRHETAQLHFWARDKVGSQAEVDYVITCNSMIVPIEVKASTVGRLKSLHAFMAEKKSSIGIRICEAPLSLHNNILSVPFYMLSELQRLFNLCRMI